MEINNYLVDKWVEAIITVKFDLEEGQLTDFCYPKNRYPHALTKLLAYFSFPDSYVFSPEGQLYYVFELMSEDREELYCYTFFTQKKDSTNPRGYFQKSIVLVSTVKLVKVFHVILKTINKMYFDSDMDNKTLVDAYLTLNANKPPNELLGGGKCVVSVKEKNLKVSINRVLSDV